MPRYKPPREDGDGHDEKIKDAVKYRKWMMKRVRHRAAMGDPICGSLIELESMASPFYLGMDDSDDLSDLDE